MPEEWEEGVEFIERVVEITRVDKVHKGGRTLSWRALVVVGDGQGRVGAAIGKAGEIPEAIRKGTEKAQSEMITVPLVGTTIPHEVNCRYQCARVILRPASEGTGVIAGGAVRAVMEAAGVKDVLTKVLGSKNPVNVVWATLRGLQQLRSVEQVAALRGKRPEDIPFRPWGRRTENGGTAKD
ncbi:MAG TPA: 30S ribosomal protein S5 [Armatimonadetes bacterium]|nr:30S ribosomal protein S5 [Armatimonadota bacterium]